jgi:hypothetical protein
VAGATHDAERLVAQHLALQVGRRVVARREVEEPDDEVELAALQRPGREFAGQRHHAQREVRPLCQALGEGGQEDELRVIAGRDDEGLSRRERVERRGRGERGTQRGERRLHGAGELEGARRGRDAAAAAQEQGVAQGLAELGERPAGGRLRAPQPHRRARDVALEQQGFEHHQQVQIEPLEPGFHEIQKTYS